MTVARDRSKVGPRLAALRSARGIDRQTLADDAGMLLCDVDAYETGRVVPAMLHVEQLARGLDVPVDSLAPKVERQHAPALVETLSSYLRTLRLKAGLTIAEAAHLAGISARSIIRLEDSVYAGFPRNSTIAALADAYGVPVDQVTADLSRIMEIAPNQYGRGAVQTPSSMRQRASHGPKTADITERMHFARTALRQLRAERSISAQHLANQAGLTINVVSSIERGSSAAIPSLVRIAQTCGVPFSRLGLQPTGYSGDAVTFGQLLIRLRCGQGLTPNEVSERMGLPRVNSYQRYEYDHVFPEYGTMRILAVALAIPREKFIRWVDLLPVYRDINALDALLQ